MQLQLATTRVLNGHTLNCYTDKEAQNPLDFFATRRQIGEFLGYAEPNDAVKKIHQRNKERLDTFSTIVNLGGAVKSGGQFVPDLAKNIHPTTIYSFKGLLEICRYSNQPAANQVIDTLWNVAEEILRTGGFLSPAKQAELEATIRERDALKFENFNLKKELQESRSFRILGEAVSLMTGALYSHEAAKIFAQRGYDIGHYRLLKLMRDWNLLCRCKGKRWNQPNQKAIQKGYVNLQPNIGKKPDLVITPKGLQWIADRLAEKVYPLIALMTGNSNAANV